MTGLSLDITLPAYSGGQDCKAVFDKGQISAIAGPSGMGKSSLLLAIAGLLPDVQGSIQSGNDYWLREHETILQPPQRQIGFVFQDDRLFSHLTVAGNLAWIRKRSDNPVSMDREKQILDMLDLTPLQDKPVRLLSGGERKRTAIARALVGSPAWLLLDEPFNGLDQQRAACLADLLEQEMTRRQGQLSVLLVSHDNREIARLADSVYDLGPQGISRRSDDKMLDGTYLKGAVQDVDREWHLTHVDIRQHNHHSQWQIAGDHGPVGREIGLFIDPRDVAISLDRPVASSMRNQITGIVVSIDREDDPAFLRVNLDSDGVIIQARITRKSVSDLSLAPGKNVYALVKSVALDHFI